MFSLLKLRLRNKIRVKKHNTISISPHSKVKNCKILIKGRNCHLIIDEGVNIRGSFIEIDGVGCTVHISKNCIIGESCYLSARERNTSLTLGEGCMLSRNIKVMTSDGHDILKNGQRINPARSITIGNNVWLADNVTILKGVNVGDGSIVGINSTLTKSIDKTSIAVGNPAKIVSKECTWAHQLSF